MAKKKRKLTSRQAIPLPPIQRWGKGAGAKVLHSSVWDLGWLGDSGGEEEEEGEEVHRRTPIGSAAALRFLLFYFLSPIPVHTGKWLGWVACLLVDLLACWMSVRPVCLSAPDRSGLGQTDTQTHRRRDKARRVGQKGGGRRF